MASNAFKKLPPDVRRELLRHVKPAPSSSSAANKALSSVTSESRKSGARIWLFGCVGFVGCAASIPYFATRRIGNLTASDDPLSSASIRRGAFNNSGSKDAGKDTNWDLKTGTYIYPKGFAEHLKMQNVNETDLGPDIGPMVQAEKKQQQERQRQRQQKSQ